MTGITQDKDISIKNNFNVPKNGDTIEGLIFDINKNGLFVDLEGFKTGVVFPRELKESTEYLKKIKIGDKVMVKIINLDNENGYVEVSLKEAGSEQGWKNLENLMQTKEIIGGKVLKANKGGLIMEIDGIQAFMPVSQLSPEHYPRVEGGDSQKILQQLQKLVGTELKVRIINLNPREDKLIVSERATQEEKLEEAIKKYKVGDIVEGEVTGIVDFGVFIKFDNLEGLVHISELAYQLIENPADIVEVGEKVKAKIIEIDKDKVSLSIKNLKKNPWEKVREKYDTNQVVKGVVTKLNPFGVFVQLDKDIHGLAHISEFGTEEKMKEMMEVGKKYNFKILSIKPNEYRMALKPIFEEKPKTT